MLSFSEEPFIGSRTLTTWLALNKERGTNYANFECAAQTGTFKIRMISAAFSTQLEPGFMPSSHHRPPALIPIQPSISLVINFPATHREAIALETWMLTP